MPEIRGPIETQLLKAIRVIWTELDRRGITRTQWAAAAQLDLRTVSRLIKGGSTKEISTYDKLIGAAWAITSYEVKVKLLVNTGLYRIEIA